MPKDQKSIGISTADYENLIQIRDHGRFGTLTSTLRILMAEYRVNRAKQGDHVAKRWDNKEVSNETRNS